MRAAFTIRPIALVLLLSCVACHKRSVPPLTLEECDPAGYIGCIQPDAFLSIPIVDTNLSLTYSSRWVGRGQGQPAWDAQSLGLGGWSINLVQRYDRANRILISGDGTWRVVDANKLPSGELVVPSYDGSVAFVFDSAGRHVRTVDGHLGTELLKVTYDPSGHLASVDGHAHGLPVHLTVRRDPKGSPRGLIGTDGASTALKTDDKQHLTLIVDPASAETKISWNETGLVESETDPGGGIQHFTYDSSGQLASATDADDVTQKYERKTSSDNLEIHISTTMGRQWTYRVESTREGLRRTFTNPDGTQTVQTTDTRGNRVLQLADGTGWTIGTLASPVWGISSPALTPIVETRPDGVSSRRETKYDLHSQGGLPYVIAGSITTVINGACWTQHFDPAQRTDDLVDPVGRRTLSRYDEHGRLLSHIAPGIAPVSYAYNAQGRVESETLGSGTSAHTVRYSYDSTTGQIITRRPDGVVENASVDRAGRIVSLSAGDGATALFDYDASGRLTQVQPPGGVRFTIGASPSGRITGFAPPIVKDDASVEIRSYDRDGLLTTISGLGRRAVSYGYNSAGKVTSTTFDQGKRTSSYDPASGWRSQATDPSGVETHYGYAGSTPTSVTWSGAIGGSVSTKFDVNGQAVLESVDGGHDLPLGYDAAGKLTKVGGLSLTRDPASGLVTQTSVGAVESKHQFDTNGLLIRTTTTADGKLALDQRYTRDALGRIKTASETSSDGKTTFTEYSYDRADRLKSVRLNGRTVEANHYDPAGNRLSSIQGAENKKAAYDDRERQLNVGGTQYTWMPDGSLAGVSDGRRATAFVYDDFGALRQASLSDGRKISYLIDADGRRVGRALAGKLVSGYLYNFDGSIAAETDGTGKITSRFAYDDLGHLALFERNGTTYRVITDPVGSPRVVIDSNSGEIVDEISYDAWGNITADKSPGFLSIGFAGGLHDPDTGLIRFGARDYDPVEGRWTAADPIRFAGGDSNLYRYAGGDPINYADAHGTCVSLGESLAADVVLTYITSLPFAIVAYGTAPGFPGGLNAAPPLQPCAPDDTTQQNTSPHSNANSGQNNGGGGFCLSPLSVGCYTNPPPVTLTPLNGTSPGNPGPPGPNGPGQPNPNSPGNPNPNGPGQPNPNGPGNPNPGGSGNPNPNGPRQPNPNKPGQPNPSDPGQPNSPPPPGPGSSGDPHLDTIRGLRFDFQTLGEFLIARSLDGNQVIEARQEPYFAGTPVTVNTAVAANVNGDRIGVYVKEPAFLVINGVPLADPDVERRLPHGGKVVRHGGTVILTWPDNSRLSIIRVAESLNYTFDPVSNADTNLVGFLGNANGASDKIAARDGSTITFFDPDFINKLYKQVGNSWRIKQSESLFHYWPGESTAKFTDLNFPPKYVSVNSLSSVDRSQAESICRAVGVRTEPLVDDCILDVAVTGMPAFAAASVGVRLRRASVSPVTASYQPAAAAPTSADHFSIKIGDTVSPNQPMMGAGIIKDVGQKQFYSFQGRAGEVIFVGQGPCEGAQPNFDLLKPDSKLLANVIGNCNANISRQTLPLTGTYTIVTSTDKSNVHSHYNFFVHAVPPDQHFFVRLPLTISPDSPRRGAGRITAPGEQQLYEFSAPSGATVHIEGKCVTACPKLAIRPIAIGKENAPFLDLNYLKSDWKLPAAGKYTIQVRSNGYVGQYGFTASINGNK
jgi:RHS repeat-associated protein